MYCCQPTSHVITGDLKIVFDFRIRSIINKGTKYPFPSNIYFTNVKKEWLMLSKNIENAGINENLLLLVLSVINK